MKCEKTNCKENAIEVCSVHAVNLCEKHYLKHSYTCEKRSIPVSIAIDLKQKHTDKLFRKVSILKEKIDEIVNELISSMNNYVKKLFYCLDQQMATVIKFIIMDRTETQINYLLDLIPDSIPWYQDPYQGLIDLVRKFNVDDFNTKVEAIEKKFEIIKTDATHVFLPTANALVECSFKPHDTYPGVSAFTHKLP